MTYLFHIIFQKYFYDTNRFYVYDCILYTCIVTYVYYILLTYWENDNGNHVQSKTAQTFQ